MVERVVPVFRAAGDEQGLCSALRLRGWQHWLLARAEAAAEAWEEAAEHARAAGLEHERSDLLGWIASSLFWGPAPVRAAIERCEAIREEVAGDLVARADMLQPLAGLHAMEGRFDEARALIAAADAAFEEVGRTLGSAVSHHAAMVELLAGDPAAAERLLRQGYAALEEMGEKAVLSTTAAFIGQALLAQGAARRGRAVRGAQRRAGSRRRHALPGHVASGPAPRCCAARGEPADAEPLRPRGGGVRGAHRRHEPIADAHVVLGSMLALRGERGGRARRALARRSSSTSARAIWSRAEQVRAQLAPLARV